VIVEHGEVGSESLDNKSGLRIGDMFADNALELPRKCPLSQRYPRGTYQHTLRSSERGDKRDYKRRIDPERFAWVV
jgi:hypothetical protein